MLAGRFGAAGVFLKGLKRLSTGLRGCSQPHHFRHLTATIAIKGVQISRQRTTGACDRVRFDEDVDAELPSALTSASGTKDGTPRTSLEEGRRPPVERERWGRKPRSRPTWYILSCRRQQRPAKASEQNLRATFVSLLERPDENTWVHEEVQFRHIQHAEQAGRSRPDRLRGAPPGVISRSACWVALRVRSPTCCRPRPRLVSCTTRSVGYSARSAWTNQEADDLVGRGHSIARSSASGPPAWPSTPPRRRSRRSSSPTASIRC